MTDAFTDPKSDILLDTIDSMEEAVVAYDADGRLLVCNRAFREMYGYREDQVQPGVHFRQLGKIDLQQGNVVVGDEQGSDYLERKARYRRELRGSFTVKLRDGRWIRTTDRPLAGGGFVSVQVDVTDIKDAQARAREAQLESARHQSELALLNADLERQVAERTRLLELAREMAEARARTDALTGLANRGAFLEQAERIHETARRYGRGYALMILDLDHFKRLNDTFGHLAGDRALEAFAKVLGSSIRQVDFAGRLGGEEFVSIAPETNAASLERLANRLCASVAGLEIPFRDASLSMTVSIGIAELSQSDVTLEEVMSRADDALYQAKSQGRNRVVNANG